MQIIKVGWYNIKFNFETNKNNFIWDRFKSKFQWTQCEIKHDCVGKYQLGALVGKYLIWAGYLGTDNVMFWGAWDLYADQKFFSCISNVRKCLWKIYFVQWVHNGPE